MTNPFYNKTGNPQSQSRGLSSQIRNEFALIEQGFDDVAPINSPAFTGTPTAPTPAPGTASTTIATTAFVMSAALDANIPGQTGSAGKFLSTDGTNPSWQSALKSTDIGVTVQGYDAETVKTSSSQTLTNKTISYASNTLTGVQPTLVSGTNIKTVNSTSLLGSGNISVLGTDVGYSSVGSFVLAVNYPNVASDTMVGSTKAGSTLLPVFISVSSGSISVSQIGGTPALTGTWRILNSAQSGVTSLVLAQRIS